MSDATLRERIAGKLLLFGASLGKDPHIVKTTIDAILADPDIKKGLELLEKQGADMNKPIEKAKP